MWAKVFRRDWWHHWCEYAVVDLDPRGDWRLMFDEWRRLATGYRRFHSQGRCGCVAERPVAYL
jgi:hypothetical protein